MTYPDVWREQRIPRTKPFQHKANYKITSPPEKKVFSHKNNFTECQMLTMSQVPGAFFKKNSGGTLGPAPLICTALHFFQSLE